MKTITNPEWESAPFEMIWIWHGSVPKDKQFPTRRFPTEPPMSIADPSFHKWALENEVPQFIEVAD